MLEGYGSSRGASLESVAGPALTVLYFLWQSKEKTPLLQSASTALLCDLALQLLCPKRSLQNKEMRNIVQSLAMNLLENQLPEALLRGLTPMQSVMALNLLMQLSLLAEAKENKNLGRLMVKGILFEGAPGIGKTYLSLEILKSLGFKEATLDDMETDSKKAYILAPTDDLLRCKKIIKCAQERGYIVLLDELNTISLETTARNERSVIAQLTEAMEAGNEMMNNDFFVIANQNTAASYSNRITLPPELLSQFMVIDPGHFRKRDYRFLAEIHKAEHPNECAALMKQAVKAYEKKTRSLPPTHYQNAVGLYYGEQHA